MKAPSIPARIRTAFRDHPVRSTLMLLAMLWIVAIRFYNVYKIDDQNARISSTIEAFGDIAAGKTAADLGSTHHFAVLSAHVYGDKRPWDVPGCKYREVLAEWKPLQLPDSAPTVPRDANGRQARLDSKLEYGVWYRERPPASRIDVALVFRGTDGAGDFWSNLRWVTRLFGSSWDQYDLVRTLAPYVEEHAARTFPGRDIRVVAAGHSLGGGLAQQAGYAGSNIRTVYAFDSSSVTGFYDVDKAVRDRAKVGMRVYRLNERGEILEYLRSAMTLIYPVAEKDPQIVQVTYNFAKGGAVGQHSIQKLACALIRAHGTTNPT